jgi:hypothetical protein
MAHEFVILRDGILEKYDKYEDIPEVFDRLIKFVPEIPPEPHTYENHNEINSWEQRFKDLIQKLKQ